MTFRHKDNTYFSKDNTKLLHIDYFDVSMTQGMMLFLSPASVFLKKHLSRGISMNVRVCNQSMPMPDYGPLEITGSELMNGIKVASAKPFNFQYGACTIMYQAGSRYEVGDQLGASHFVRAMSSGSGCGHSAFMKSRRLQQLGGTLSCSADRQTVAFTLCCPITSFAELNGYLLDTAARCCYHKWEIDDCRSIIREDLVRISPEQMVMDLILKASFSGPLSNSVFCAEERVDSFSREEMLSFVENNFKSVRCSVGSVGVPFEETMKMAEKIDMKREKPPDPLVASSRPKCGYECHDLGAGSDTWIAVAVPGCSSRDISSLLKHSIVAAACGSRPLQRGSHASDRAPQPPLGAMAADPCTEYTAFNISYVDQGIFGILAKTRAQTARQVALSAAEFLAHVGDLDFRQIDVGKRRLKLSLARHDEHCARFAEGLALRAGAAAYTPPAALLAAAKPEDVVVTARTLACNSAIMSVAVVGDVGAVPAGTELLRG